MGCVDTISAARFPRQGSWAGRRVRVMFHFTGPEVLGVIVREDAEEPGVTIIKLDDGRFVLSTECQYTPFREPPASAAGGAS